MPADSGTNSAQWRVWTMSVAVGITSDGIGMEEISCCNQPACGWCARSLRCLGWNWRPVKPEQICFACPSTINTGLIFSVVLTKTITIGGWYVLNLWQMTTRDVILGSQLVHWQLTLCSPTGGPKYSKLIVRWNDCFSESRIVKSEIRPGGILSPIFFNIHMDVLLNTLKSFNHLNMDAILVGLMHLLVV